MPRYTTNELGLTYPVQNNTIIVEADGWNKLNDELVNMAQNRYDFSYKNDGLIDSHRFYFYLDGIKTYFEKAETYFIPKPYVLLSKENKVNSNDIIYATTFNPTNNKAYFLNTNEIQTATKTKGNIKHTYNFSSIFRGGGDGVLNGDGTQWCAQVQYGSDEAPIRFPPPREVYEEECQKFYNNMANKAKKDDLITAKIFKTVYDNYNNSDFCFNIVEVILTYTLTTLLGEVTYKGTIKNIENYDTNDKTEFEVTNVIQI